MPVTGLPSPCSLLPVVGLGGRGLSATQPLLGHRKHRSARSPPFQPCPPVRDQHTDNRSPLPPRFRLPFGRQDTAGKGRAFGCRRLGSTGAPGQQVPQVSLGRAFPPQQVIPCFSQTSGDPTAGGPAGSGGGGTAAPTSSCADLDSGLQQGGAGPQESLMNINEQRRVKKINLPDPPIGAVVTI